MRNRRALERDRERLSLLGFFRRAPGKGAAEFNPVLLFAKYNATGLYIPNFIPSHPAPIGTTRLFQDDEATTPATIATNPLGAIIDSGPAGITINQATDNSRLLLAEGNADARWVARGDGIADNALTTLNHGASGTYIFAVEFNAVSQAVGGATGGAGNHGDIQLDAGGNLTARVGAVADLNTGNVGGDVRDIPGVAALRFSGGTAALFWRPFTGAFAKLVEGAYTGAPVTSVGIRIGANNGNGTANSFLNGDIYAVFAIRAALSDGEIAAVADRFSRA